jgi:SAM-dependent methyltransferase
MLEFLARNTQGQDIPPVSLPEGEGEVAGLIYRVQGSGPPLVLLPMQYSPSQWDSLLPRLSQSYCTITLGGPNLGAIFSLEARAKGGYLEPVRRLVAELQLQSGEKIMDVGCGPGSIDRWLAHHTGQANPIVGVDPGSYLLREARAMAQSEGLAEVLTFQEGGGESLPFPDNSFDVAMSLTAIQYVDADRMLREMRRLLGWEAE